MLNEQEIASLTRESTSGTAAAKHVLENFKPFVANLGAQKTSDLLGKIGEDSLAKSMLPDDFKKFTPLRSKGDGNCLFNSTSITLQGDEKLASMLRLLVACELLVHAEFYATHPQLAEMTTAESSYGIKSLIWVLLSDQTASDVYDGKLENVPEAIRMLAQRVSTPGVYATVYHIMALSSVIGRPVYSVYPELKSSLRVKNCIHRQFFPRETFLAKEESFSMPPPIYIMWTRTSHCMQNIWKPNHFVPLISSIEQSSGVLSYADVVRGKAETTEGVSKKDQAGTALKKEAGDKSLPSMLKKTLKSAEDRAGNKSQSNKPITEKKSTETEDVKIQSEIKSMEKEKKAQSQSESKSKEDAEMVKSVKAQSEPEPEQNIGREKLEEKPHSFEEKENIHKEKENALFEEEEKTLEKQNGKKAKCIAENGKIENKTAKKKQSEPVKKNLEKAKYKKFQSESERGNMEKKMDKEAQSEPGKKNMEKKMDKKAQSKPEMKNMEKKTHKKEQSEPEKDITGNETDKKVKSEPQKNITEKKTDKKVQSKLEEEITEKKTDKKEQSEPEKDITGNETDKKVQSEPQKNITEKKTDKKVQSEPEKEITEKKTDKKVPSEPEKESMEKKTDKKVESKLEKEITEKKTDKKEQSEPEKNITENETDKKVKSEPEKDITKKKTDRKVQSELEKDITEKKMDKKVQSEPEKETTEKKLHMKAPCDLGEEKVKGDKEKMVKSEPEKQPTECNEQETERPESGAPVKSEEVKNQTQSLPYSLAGQLWELKRKSNQCHSPQIANTKRKADSSPLITHLIGGKKSKIAKKEGTDEAMNVEPNASNLGTYLYGLHSSAYNKPNRKYLSKKKPTATTLAFGFNKYYSDETEKLNTDKREQSSTRNVSSSIKNYCTNEIPKGIASENPLLTLATSPEWHKKQGLLSRVNTARSAKRKSCQTGEIVVKDKKFSFSLGSQTSESLSDSIGRLEKMALAAQGKDKARLSGIMEVACCLRDSFPLMKTQKAGQIYKTKISESDETRKEDEAKTTRTTSSEIDTILSKQLNIMHLYINGTGFIMESKTEGPFREFFEQMDDLLRTENFKTSVNRHIENEIGKSYKTVLGYMDTERDKNAMKYIVAKITSVKFASKLQTTSNKASIKRSLNIIPNHLRRFSELREDIRKELGKRNLSKRQERYLMKRTLEAEKMRQMRVRNSERTGRKLKVDEFPDLVAILEYEFGEGDHRERGGGGLESHSKLRSELLYRAADNKTKMKDAREAILALAPEDFTVSLSTCFNYTQNFRKGTLEAKRHHEGRGVNACVSLHKAPDTAPIKDRVINIHWTSSNVNYVLDKASKESNVYCVDSRDAKQVIRANTGHGGRTWKNIQTPDHTFDTSRTSAVTPMTHLLLETIETKRTVTLNKHPKLQEIYLSPSPRSDVVVHIKRSGRAVTMLNLSYYEPETIFRSINEFLYMITLPSLDSCFRNPATGKMKEVFVSIVDNGIEKPRSPLVKMLLVRLRRLLGLKAVAHMSFAEYHSKRNPVERVHAVHTKELEKHGPFKVKNLNADSVEHKTKMEEMRGEVEEVLKQAKFGGKYTMVMKGVGCENNFVFDDMTNLHAFLSMNEDRKAKCEMQYQLNKDSNILKELNQVWNVDTTMTGSYSDDYEIINNKKSSIHRTAWTDKYTTVLFDEESPSEFEWKQPIPDYVRWYLTGGEQHYMTYEERSLLRKGPWDDIEELFLPSKILDLFDLVHPCISHRLYADLALLTWCSEEEVENYLSNKKEDALKDLESCLHLAQWRDHDLFRKSKASLEEMCRKHNLGTDDSKSKLVEKLCRRLNLEEPAEIKEFEGDLSVIPTQLQEIAKLPVYKLKQFLHYYNIPWTGSKDQLSLRVLALRTGTTHILFQRERDGILEMLDMAQQLISAQKDVKILSNEFVVRKRAFSTPEGNSLSSSRPRESAGQPCNKNNVKVPVPEGSTLSCLEDIFDNIKREITLLNNDSAKKYDPYNLTAIRSSRGRVMVKWTDDDNRKGWKPGWYTAIIKKYLKALDIIEIEYVSEPGKIYKVNVNESLEKGTLRLHVTTCEVPDLYDQVSEIGASLSIKWSKEEVKGSGWKAGWHHAEVQSFDPDNDEITVIYKGEPTVIYTECVTKLISEGKVKRIK